MAASFDALGPIPFSQLQNLQMLERCGGGVRAVKRLGSHLAPRTDPSPVPDQGHLAKQSWLQRQRVEARHVPAGV